MKIEVTEAKIIEEWIFFDDKDLKALSLDDKFEIVKEGKDCHTVMHTQFKDNGITIVRKYNIVEK